MSSTILAKRSSAETDPEVFKGAVLCCVDECGKKAYYRMAEQYVCGNHSRGRKRTELRADPQRKNKEQALLDAQLAAMPSGGGRGQLFMRKLRMFGGSKPTKDGCYTVLPNNRAKSNHELILAMPALSPMRLGPVEHNQPGLPPARNLENFHQFNKCFQSELDAAGNPLPIFFERQLAGYEDEVPHRHKLGATKEAHMRAAGIARGSNANACAFSVFVNPQTGQVKRYSYLESRIFYCSFYEMLARRTLEYAHLEALLARGASLLIAGYDAIDVDEPVTAQQINQWYADPAQPFGHEKVLFAMLNNVMPWHLVPVNFPLEQ